MSVPTTLTLNVGSPAADVVFEKTSDGTVGVSHFKADSPQDDLAGQPEILLRHQTTKSGLVRSNLKIQVPQYNSSDNEYDGHCQVDVTLTRKETLAIAEADRTLEMAEKALTQIRDEIAAQEY